MFSLKKSFVCLGDPCLEEFLEFPGKSSILLSMHPQEKIWRGGGHTAVAAAAHENLMSPPPSISFLGRAPPPKIKQNRSFPRNPRISLRHQGNHRFRHVSFDFAVGARLSAPRKDLERGGDMLLLLLQRMKT